ncbi:MAG: peptidase, partial [Saprospiraceae bacterium]|nr:peptidase [Saprospiraceae bacterium]
FGHYHHTSDDDMDVIDRNTLRAVGQVVLALLYKESVDAI